MKKALRLLTKSSATLIAPLGDPDAGDQIPSLKEISLLISSAVNNPNDPWVALNTMETMVLGSEITAFGIIDYDPEAIARQQMARMAAAQSPQQSIGAPKEPTIDFSAAPDGAEIVLPEAATTDVNGTAGYTSTEPDDVAVAEAPAAIG